MSNKWILSATEIDTFQTCRRKWAYQYLDGIKPPQSEAAKFGSAVHRFLEKHLTGDTIDHHSTEGRIASPGLDFLPKQLAKENVERPFIFMKRGFIFQGYIDFCQKLDQDTWLIGDHKTCSSFSSALPAHALKTNIQAIIYAQWACEEMGAKTVKLNWIYYRTKSKPEARLVEAEIKSEEAPQLFEPQLKIAADIKELVEKKPSSSELPKNLSACFKYGRCPYYAACKYGATKAPSDQLKPLLRETARDGASALIPAPPFIESKLNQEAFHLYIDCVPTKSEHAYQRTIELSELLKPVLIKIQTEKELSHYRLAGYGQHVGLIANYLSEHLKKNAYDNRTAILSSLKTPEGCDTLQTLTAAAGQVVRGF